jgi:hypothetical protein
MVAFASVTTILMTTTRPCGYSPKIICGCWSVRHKTQFAGVRRVLLRFITILLLSNTRMRPFQGCHFPEAPQVLLGSTVLGR